FLGHQIRDDDLVRPKVARNLRWRHQAGYRELRGNAWRTGAKLDALPQRGGQSYVGIYLVFDRRQRQRDQ
ncbi:MAG TPA: hypothetical protein VLG47_07440, partial [Candidatus Saccharimonadales bacterium]|nr:hypothetical protein [Candidatus Saccharimonadales bacterium]